VQGGVCIKLFTIRALLLGIGLLLSLFTIMPDIQSEADGSAMDVVINEFLARPNSDWDGDDIYDASDDEWIELYNPTDTIVNVTGCFIGDSGTAWQMIEKDGEIPSFGFLVLFGSDNESLSLNNQGDTIELYDKDGVTLIDRYIYYETYEDESEGRETDGASSWTYFSVPTPSKRNYDLPPVIGFVHHYPLNPKSSDTVTIVAGAHDDYELLFTNLSYYLNGGNFLNIQMKDDGVFPDLLASDGNFTSQIPPQASGTDVRFYVTCVDDYNQNVTVPDSAPVTCNAFSYSDEEIKVVINEFLPSPDTDWNNDSYIDSDDEWIELYNHGDCVVNIGGWQLDDELGTVGSSDPYTITDGTIIEPKEFLLFYGNETEITLNNNGDNVTLLDEEKAEVDIFSFSLSDYDVALGRFPDGIDNKKNFLVPTPQDENIYPVDSLENLSSIKINEFMSTPKTAYSSEWIELYNSGLNPVRLDGCLLDDIIGGGKKPWQIPLNSTIQPKETLLFERTFGLNNAGDTVNLIYDDGTTIIDQYTYDLSEYDISFGRNGDGNEDWVSYSNPTPDYSNTPMQKLSSAEASLIISELFFRASEEEEFLCLYNPSESEVDLSGFRIADGKVSYSGSIIFPEDAAISSKEHLYVASNAVVFRNMMGFYPDYEYGNSSDSIPDMVAREKPSFAVLKDEALLMDSFGNLIDIVVYGDSEYTGLGWEGSPVSDAKKGEILKRNFDESTSCYHDTNASWDWEHMRHYKPGQSGFEYESFSYTGSMILFASPDSSYETIVKEIQSAKSSILIGLYQFTNWNISQKILERLGQGVDVKILMEGSPADGMAEEQKYILQKIHENGGEIRFMVTNSTLGSRYRYIHAKYVVIDSQAIIISSENWKYTGIPINNTHGNRGWGVVIRNSSVSSYFTDVFLADWDSVGYDVFSFTPKDKRYGNASSDFEVDDWVETGYYNPVFPSKILEGEFSVSPVISPDTSLSENEGILGLINNAQESIYIEQLDFALNWNDGDKVHENPFLLAALAAADERHVDVRILLSQKYSYLNNTELDNYDTYVYINGIAEDRNITEYLEARLVDYDRLGLSKVHNKGMIVDGTWTLISSINWNRNSVCQNREIGVIIENKEVAQYFTELFLWDWNEPPYASANDVESATVSQGLQFTDMSFDKDNNILQYYWDFGDGTNSTEQNPIHLYESEGTYNVVLTVSDGQYQDSYSFTVLVSEVEVEENEQMATAYIALLIIFLIITIIIIYFIRKMRLLLI
jgi:phosphatidylserine/phosphatidylglycerophosphate/cardiolipin synthase-like enzyme